MKKLITTLLLLFVALCSFAEGQKYTEEDLLDYLENIPGASLPKENEKIEIRDGFFSIESATIDGPGVDYIVKFIGARTSSLIFSRLIYIYSEKMETRKLWQGQSLIMNATPLTIYYTGKTAPAIDEEGNRINIPIFIAD